VKFKGPGGDTDELERGRALRFRAERRNDGNVGKGRWVRATAELHGNQTTTPPVVTIMRRHNTCGQSLGRYTYRGQDGS